jgi:hypothetical protein
MRDSTLVFDKETLDGTELVVNFGLYSGREATQAEIDRLAGVLAGDVESFSVVSQTRYSFGREIEASVYQVRIELPSGTEKRAIARAVQQWARDCIAERSLLD